MTRRVRICPQCGHENAPTAPVCAMDGTILRDDPVVIPDRPEPGGTGDDAHSCDPRSVPAAGVDAADAETIRLRALGADIVLTVARNQVVGRLVPGEHAQPDVDVGGVPERDTVSRRHVRFLRHSDGWYACNLSATNFITLGDRVIEGQGMEVAVTEGCRLGLSNVLFVVEGVDHS